MSTEEQRMISRWTIGSTLEKGGYSWSKLGKDIHTGKIVKLKFMEKLDISLSKEKIKELHAKVEAIKNIRHDNVVKLYTYNLNAKYPLASQSFVYPNQNHDDKKDEKYIDTILLVEEHFSGGELFDILYYTSTVKEAVARTFFKQIISGLEALHKANVFCLDIQPQNILLDAKYNIKISNFGISQIIQSNADTILKTTYVKDRGYQAPELLLNHPYTQKCDIFSAAVILFILMAGYPPFEQASKNDKWFKPLMKGKIYKFWKHHSKSRIAQMPDLKDLLTAMLSFDPSKRIDIDAIKSHKWYQGETLQMHELFSQIYIHHQQAEKKRRMDVRKLNDVASTLHNYGIPDHVFEKCSLNFFPFEYVEGMFGEAYTYPEVKNDWYDLYTLINKAIINKGRGECYFDFDTGTLQCKMSITANNNRVLEIEHKLEFDINIFKSRFWTDKYKNLENCDEIIEQNEHVILVVKVTRRMGNQLVFNRIKNQFILGYCSPLIRGLPVWAKKMEKEQRRVYEETYEHNSQCLVMGYMKENFGKDIFFEKSIIDICFSYYFSDTNACYFNDLEYLRNAQLIGKDDKYEQQLQDIFKNQNNEALK